MSRPSISPVTASYCESFLCQLRGLTFRRFISPKDGLLLVQKRESRLDSAIHMLGVPIDLAVIWINSEGEVVDARLALRWRPAYISRRPARYVLEMCAERLGDYLVGDKVSFEEISLH